MSRRSRSVSWAAWPLALLLLVGCASRYVVAVGPQHVPNCSHTFLAPAGWYRVTSNLFPEVAIVTEADADDSRIGVDARTLSLPPGVDREQVLVESVRVLEDKMTKLGLTVTESHPSTLGGRRAIRHSGTRPDGRRVVGVHAYEDDRLVCVSLITTPERLARDLAAFEGVLTSFRYGPSGPRPPSP